MSGKRKVIDYDVIIQQSQSGLVREVKLAIKYNWSLVGGSYYVVQGYYAQTMVKYEDKEDIQ